MALDERGHSLAECLCRKASAACTARRLLHDLLGRINELNASLHFLARVKRAIVFGSFLSNVDRLGDVDVAIEWERREKDWDKHHQANNERVAEEVRKGRHFANMVDELDWWRREAILFLRNRKRGLSIHDYASDREVVDAAPHEVVFVRLEQIDSRVPRSVGGEKPKPGPACSRSALT